ncbi:MAG: multiheme c-type cytochrome [Pseudomonadales bacterium]
MQQKLSSGWNTLASLRFTSVRKQLSIMKLLSYVFFVTTAFLTASAQAEVMSGWLTEEQEKEVAALIVGPTKNDDNCSSCHALETEAWENTRHFATFKDRHRSDRAKEILANMGEKSMKRSDDCRQCHYTSELKNEKIRASFGVSCESCHGAARNWLAVHSKGAGDINASDLKWGTGKDQDPANRAKRLEAAQAKGMIHSEMIYEIARNCFACHTVPNENIVNKGAHKAGSDFDLLAWSQGENLHNFSSSAGAPDAPTNRPSSSQQKRRLYVTGLMVDLETSLANISQVKDKGGIYHLAMVKRSNDVRAKLDKVMAAVTLNELGAALSSVPATIEESTSIAGDLPAKLGAATRAFLAAHDGTDLGAIDALMTTEYKGTPFQ